MAEYKGVEVTLANVIVAVKFSVIVRDGQDENAMRANLTAQVKDAVEYHAGYNADFEDDDLVVTVIDAQAETLAYEELPGGADLIDIETYAAARGSGS